MRAALLLLPLALCAACLRQIEYRCTIDAQCTPNGRCQIAVGYCSFPDSECASGQRFSDLAGLFALQCVGDASGGDGGIDAPDDAPASGCPVNYSSLTGGTAGHFYRRAPNNLDWVQQDNFCRSTSPRAYLAIPQDLAELMALHTLAAGTFWIGVSDRVTEGAFVMVTGGAATYLPWAAGQPDNGGGGQGEDCVAATATSFSDEECTGGGSNRPAVCECVP